jgi:hypothetical protein
MAGCLLLPKADKSSQKLTKSQQNHTKRETEMLSIVATFEEF